MKTEENEAVRLRRAAKALVLYKNPLTRERKGIFVQLVEPRRISRCPHILTERESPLISYIISQFKVFVKWFYLVNF